MRRWILSGLLAVLLIGFTTATARPDAAAPLPKPTPKTTAEKLFGKWEVVKASDKIPPGWTSVVEYCVDGTYIWMLNTPDGNGSVSSKWKLDEKTITVTTQIGDSEKSHETSRKIKKLTDDALITVDPFDHFVEFKRVQD